ncbi:MAG TPA: dephospho-CoA kinase [Tepidisphaeraceae bacterium]|jgi:dephospho-CoA kinase
MFSGKPIIGITGGIGSGKSFVARLFGELGCAVIDADAQVREAYDDPQVRQTLRQWWGDEAFKPDGTLDRSAVARRIFNDPDERRRLEGLLHPMVHAARQRQMGILSQDPGTIAFVWDAPLLFEVGLNDQCDAVVFVDAPFEVRLDRVTRGRNWDEAELLRRENLQWPLDKKREIADYIVRNTADAGEARSQVRAVLSRILERASHGPGPT